MEYTNQDVRRQDCLLDEVRAFEILKEGEFGILSMRTEEGDGAYGIPINYVWDRGNSIYIHCAPVGVNCAALTPALTCLSVSPVAVKLSRTSLLRDMKASYCNVRHITVCTKQSGCLPSRC